MPEEISKGIQETGCQPALGGAPDIDVRCAPDCPVRAPDGLHREATDRRSLAVAPNCPVCIGLSGVPRADGNGRIQRSTATDANGWLTWRAPDTVQ
jgi:hypothetical protein